MLFNEGQLIWHIKMTIYHKTLNLFKFDCDTWAHWNPFLEPNNT